VDGERRASVVEDQQRRQDTLGQPWRRELAWMVVPLPRNGHERLLPTLRTGSLPPRNGLPAYDAVDPQTRFLRPRKTDRDLRRLGQPSRRAGGRSTFCRTSTPRYAPRQPSRGHRRLGAERGVPRLRDPDEAKIKTNVLPGRASRSSTSLRTSWFGDRSRPRPAVGHVLAETSLRDRERVDLYRAPTGRPDGTAAGSNQPSTRTPRATKGGQGTSGFHRTPMRLPGPGGLFGTPGLRPRRDGRCRRLPPKGGRNPHPSSGIMRDWYAGATWKTRT